MKIILEISEQDAACIWADQTWEGKQNKRIGKIVADVVEDAAAKDRQAFPAAVSRVTTKFRTDEINREGPHFVLLGYSAAHGSNWQSCKRGSPRRWKRDSMSVRRATRRALTQNTTRSAA